MGNRGRVYRDGDLVRRPSGAHRVAVNALLEELERRSFPAPVPMGYDDHGSQLFRWIDGDVPVPPAPPWALTEAALTSVGRLVRQYHDAVAGLSLLFDLDWSGELADPQGGSIICHNDICPPNVVFQKGQAHALLDFDFAAPGRPVWDLALTARMWLRLRPPIDADGPPQADPFRGIRFLANGYGLPHGDYGELVDAIVESFVVGSKFVRDRVAERQGDYVKAWKRLGGEGGNELTLIWLAQHRDAMLAALSDH